MDSKVKLDKTQRAALTEGYLGDALEAPTSIQCYMLLLLDDGNSIEEVARLTFSTVEDVKDCVCRLREGGVAAIIRD